MSSQQASQDSFDAPVPGATAWPRPEVVEYDSDDSFDADVPGAIPWVRPEVVEYDSDDSFDADVPGAIPWVRPVPNQHGSGPLKPTPKAADVTPNLHYPTTDEIDYLKKYAVITSVSPPATLNPRVIHCGENAFRLKDLDDIPDSLAPHMEKLLDIFIRTMYQRNGADLEKDKYWLSLGNLGAGSKAFHVNHQTYLKATGHHVMNNVATTMQSHKELSLNDPLEVEMFIFKMTTKGGCRKTSKIVETLLCPTHHVRANTHCLPIALLIGKHYYEMTSRQMQNLVRTGPTRQGNPRKSIGERQVCAARAMLAKNGIVDEESGVFDFDLVKTLCATDDFKEYRVDVFVQGGSPHTMQRSNVFPPVNPDAKRSIAIFYHDGHYEPINITSIEIGKRSGFYFCTKCSQMVEEVKNIANHKDHCDARCRKCGSFTCNDRTPGFKRTCGECNTIFFDQGCFDQHLKKEKGEGQRDTLRSHCQKFMFCDECKQKVKRPGDGGKHICNHKFCPICREVLHKNHECSFAPPSQTERKKCLAAQEFWRFFVYDFESIVTDSVDAPDEEETTKGSPHVPNLVCGQFICSRCPPQQESKKGLASCLSCGPMVTIKYDNDDYGNGWPVVKRFAHFIATDPRFDKCTILAHNGGKYDHGFVIPELTAVEDVVPEMLMDGIKIIQAKVTFKNGHTVTFKDTLNFIPMALKQMPKAFGFAQDLVKGTFPYMFNHPSRYGRTFPAHPDRAYYQPYLMTEKEIPSFELWYEENKDKPYDFDKEIQLYCESDVEILVKAVRKYLEICAGVFQNWNPIVQCTTLASFVMFVMKYEHMKKGVVGYIPENGFPSRNNSVLALKYLQWLDEQDPSLRIQHALNGGEAKITTEDHTYYADGYSEANNTVYEVHGCMWHGCPQCYPDSSMMCPCRPGITFETLLRETKEREDNLRSAGFGVHVMWECQIKREMAKNRLMKAFFKECRHTYQLQPRESMFGGRTQQFQAYVEEDANHTLEYYDYCSLYPWTNMKGAEYPMGQPQRITFDFSIPKKGEPLAYRGLVFCDVLPPRRLDFPVLPYRANSKLLFPLCRKCGDATKGEVCTHTNTNDRYLTGCWVTDELNYAIERGYEVMRIHEAWHWSDEKWFRGGFFSSFLEPLLRLKHEASGWPKPNMTDEEKATHIDTIAANDRVQIRGDHVAPNPALRQTAKLFLNSAWGKFAQNPKKSEVKVMSKENGDAITNFFETPGFDPKHVGIWGSDHVLMSRLPQTDSLRPSKFSNIVYGSITTAVARLRLHKAMERVGAENLIYCDTDSVIFKQRVGEDLLGDLRGDGLGMMTNEIPAGSRITRVVTVAPKVYGLEIADASGKVSYSIKAKGMTLNRKTAESVSFENLRKMMVCHVQGENVDPLEGRSMTIKSTLKRPGVKETHHVSKRLRPVGGKGVMDGIRTLPYGLLGDNVKIVDDYPFIQ